jgi:DNA processing protein
MLSDPTTKALPWFSLKSVPGVGNYIFKRLIDHFKSPESVFEASRDDLLQVEGMHDRLASAIKRHKIPETIKNDLNLAIQKGYGIVTMADMNYPSLLAQIPDPPPYLYVYGSLDDPTKAISVVGSRNATTYGISTTKRLCADLASLDFIVVSGMARGIDSAAHTGALMGQGKTIAVLGSGLERIYPPENRRLFHEIAENGAVISEFPLMMGPEPHNFPIRNRIISGISLGTVIVEATNRSGSLITARLAAEQNREVFAVPGSIHSFKSTGTHALIKQGAKLVEHAQDIIEELTHIFSLNTESDHASRNPLADKLPQMSPEECIVFEALDPYPAHIDDLVRKISIEPGKLLSILLKLELKGIVQQFPGKRFSTSID